MARAYPTRKLGPDGPTVSAIGFGVGSFGDFYGKANQADAPLLLSYAADHGVTFWDTSNYYGASERLIGEWFASTGRRSEIFLASKFGAAPRPDGPHKGKPSSDPESIVRAIEDSLKTLQTDYIDLYYQHRVDPTIPIEVVLETLRPYVERGTIRWVGLSECSPATLRRAKAVPIIGPKLIAVQMEYSPFETSIETSGLRATATELGVAVVAYSPLGRGLVTGRYRSPDDFAENDLRRLMPRYSKENFPANLVLVDEFKKLADKYSAKPGQIALAWLLAQDPYVVPIPGTMALSRLQENSNAAFLTLKPEDLTHIRKLVDNADIQGARSGNMANLVGDCVELADWEKQKGN
ncbi:Aldo-ket-red domain-containing protein [Mycena chlorophos]|uniref:Aldo-ket-red domain-containing protein n=1 Tax=Mycena chlorophos TaxID=658473 RepID=A0A8H6TQA8_MYCCL|nr:Aldo-ket-red domain-containing protein [Mycena chlorophos]